MRIEDLREKLSEKAADLSDKKKQIAKEAKALRQLKQIEFPIDIFPKSIEEMIRGYNRVFGAAHEHYALAFLTVGGAAIGNAVWIEERGNTQPPLIYAIIVDKPSTGKSPIAKTVLAPMYRVEKTYRKEYAEKLREADGDDNGLTPPREIVLNDITVESVYRTLHNNPRGTVVFRDEVTGWMASMNQYKKGGGDEAFWLETWNAGTVKVSRVGRRNALFIDKPFCAVLGGTQPAILKSFMAGDKGGNGFFARLLFSYPDDSQKQSYSKSKPDPAHLERWTCIIDRLMAIPVEEDRPEDSFGDWDVTPTLLNLSKEAEVAYRQFFDNNAREINQSEDEVTQAILGKFDNYVLRIALILHLLHWAEGGPDDPELEEIKAMEVSAEAMAGAIKAMAYFKATSLKVVNRLAGPVEALPEAQQLWYRSLPEEFQRGEALELAKSADISERHLARLLKREDLFKKLRQGFYFKLHWD